MWLSQKVGGGEVEIPPSLCFPPKHLINSLKERCNVFCIYTCLTLRWKVICSCHHSKLIKNEMTGLSRAVRSRCSVMGCRSYRLNFSRGRGRVERERTIYNKLLNKNCCDWNTVIHIYTSHDYKTEFKPYTCIYICHFNNLDVFFVSFQNRERVHSSEKQRKWRSDRTKGKVQFVRCFYGNIDQWVISQKIVKLSELQFVFTSCKQKFWDFLRNSCDQFLQLH